MAREKDSGSAAARGSGSRALSAAGCVYLGLLALQFGVQPILYQEFSPAGIPKKSIVLMGELTKYLLSGTMLVLSGQSKQAMAGWTFWDSIMLAGAPAAVYTVQNVCIQIAISNMDGLTFNLLNQSKILFTALALYVLMGRRQSMIQCIGLLGLFAASCTLTRAKMPLWQFLAALPFVSRGLLCFPTMTLSSVPYSSGPADIGWIRLLYVPNQTESASGSQENSFYLGIVPCLVASLLSGIASALSQIALQSKDRHSLLFTMELAFFSSLSIVASEAVNGMPLKNLLSGWTPKAMIPIISNGMGGICVGLVVKHAGGVRKGFSIVGGIIITGVAQYIMYETPLTPEIVLALPVVIVSMLLHIMYPYVPVTETAESKKSK